MITWYYIITARPRGAERILIMNEYLQQLLDGKIDFEGQKLVEQIVKITLISSTIFSFLLGFALQSLQVTFGIFALSVIVLCLVVLPHWPVYNRHPVQWLPVKDKKTT
ncbi:microsomal signal peptidase subunit [Sparassis latifolia]|uniref:Signal peptidase complex subunit 1 n=1 Tax=Sparassis crispa TaxID=139825 RepID=A0A401GU96_9APHY|nr:Signal peptidase complex subunit SPC1 [Sparassis crispa]GBE85797.1 Signal peptidase complex subunit SPC1 [Sparassis crispa]